MSYNFENDLNTTPIDAELDKDQKLEDKPEQE